MMKINTRVRILCHVLHGTFCSNPECEANAVEIEKGETGIVVDSYQRGFEVKLDENGNCWWFDTDQSKLFEVIS